MLRAENIASRIPAMHMILSFVFKRELRRVLRLIGVFSHLILGATLAHTVLLLPQRLIRNTRMRGAVVRWWARAFCHLLNIRLHVHGQLSSQPTLLVANHVSWLDIPCLLGVTDAAFVSKSEVLRWPLVGAMAARAGTIFLARGGRDASTNAADEITWRLASRQSVIVFPEGTTTDGSYVRPFHARLYQAAIRTHSHIQAIAIRYGDEHALDRVAPFIDDDELLPHFWKLLGMDRIVVRLHICEPLAANLERRALAAFTRDQICTTLALASEKTFSVRP
jgi:1-acyl-sn-glycerol-3-phosphate acyltransferase